MKPKDLDDNPPSGGRQGHRTESPTGDQDVPDSRPEGGPDADPTTPPVGSPERADVVVSDPQAISSTPEASGRARSNANLMRGNADMKLAKAAKEERLAARLSNAAKKMRKGLMTEEELGELISDMLRDPEMPPHTMPALVTSLQKLPMYQQSEGGNCPRCSWHKDNPSATTEDWIMAEERGYLETPAAPAATVLSPIGATGPTVPAQCGRHKVADCQVCR